MNTICIIQNPKYQTYITNIHSKQHVIMKIIVYNINIYKKHNECFGDDISLEEFEEFRSESYDTFFERVSLIYSEIKNIYEDKYEKNI